MQEFMQELESALLAAQAALANAEAAGVPPSKIWELGAPLVQRLVEVEIRRQRAAASPKPCESSPRDYWGPEPPHYLPED